jgi:hypothetical protein
MSSKPQRKFICAVAQAFEAAGSRSERSRLAYGAAKTQSHQLVDRLHGAVAAACCDNQCHCCTAHCNCCCLCSCLLLLLLPPQTCSQVLLTLDNLADRSQYINARNTFTELLAYGTIPVVNENVSVLSHAM